MSFHGDVGRHHGGAAGVFHHRVVDRLRRAGLELGGREPHEVEIGRGGIQRGTAGVENLGTQGLQFVEKIRRAEQEHAAIPEIVAGIDILPGSGKVGFFDKRCHLVCAGGIRQRRAPADVAVAGFRRGGDDAESSEVAVLRGLRRSENGRMERRHVADQMIGGQHQHQRVGIIARQHQRGHGNRRRGVAAHRLQHDGARLGADLAHLLGDHEAVLVVAHHQRCGHFRHVCQAADSVLQQAMVAGERQQLLGQGRARQGPQAGARATGKNHRMNSGHVVRSI